jgi:hypothetical protein
LVDSVGDLSKLSKLDKTKLDRSSGLDVSHSHGGLINEPGTVSSIFWGKNIDPIGSINDAPDNSALSNSNGASKSKLSNSGFALRFSFNLSESTSPLHSQGDEKKALHHVMLLKVLQRLLSVLMEKLYRKILIFMLQRCRRSKLLLPFISRVGTAFSGFGVVGGKKGK